MCYKTGQTYLLPTLSDEQHYQLLKALEDNPNTSQRELAREVGYSLGKINYCLQALKGKGLVKAENFRNSTNKTAYLYKLTPAGISEKATITRRFLSQKLEEHEQLQRDIETLKQEVAEQTQRR